MADIVIHPDSIPETQPQQTEVVIAHDSSQAPVPPAPVSPVVQPLPVVPPAAVPESATPGPQPDSIEPAIPDVDDVPLPNAFQEPTNIFEDTDGDLSVSWTAAEFIAHEKSASWYLGLGVTAVVVAALVLLITHGIVSAVVVIVSAILLGVYGSHKPRNLEYSVDSQGINIASKQYSYDQYRSFYVVSEGAFSSVVLVPLKRFAVPLNIHCPPEEEERIVTVLSGHLPLEEARNDSVDNLMRRIRF